MNITIKGYVSDRSVEIDGLEISPGKSQKIYNHSPDGFNWGYGGSGPAQLALAILLLFTDKETAKRNYQQFKWDVIATLPQTDFQVDVYITPYLK